MLRNIAYLEVLCCVMCITNTPITLKTSVKFFFFVGLKMTNLSQFEIECFSLTSTGVFLKLKTYCVLWVVRVVGLATAPRGKDAWQWIIPRCTKDHIRIIRVSQCNLSPANLTKQQVALMIEMACQGISTVFKAILGHLDAIESRQMWNGF